MGPACGGSLWWRYRSPRTFKQAQYLQQTCRKKHLTSRLPPTRCVAHDSQNAEDVRNAPPPAEDIADHNFEDGNAYDVLPPIGHVGVKGSGDERNGDPKDPYAYAETQG